jgi:trimeric autotransporter adhesin
MTNLTDTASRHLGPRTQGFHAAFNIGLEDTGISTVNADGVALAAIQGLNQKVEVRSQRSEERIQKLEAGRATLKAANQALEHRLERLENMLSGTRENHHQPK